VCTSTQLSFRRDLQLCAERDLKAANKTFHSGSVEDASSPAAKGWFTRHRATIDVVLTDAASFAEPNSECPTRKAEREQLASAISVAKALPVIPNQTVERRWTTVLAELGDAAENCEAGIAHNDSGVFAQIPPEVMIAGDSLNLMFVGDLPSDASNSQATNFTLKCFKRGSRVGVTPANGTCL
jgi:hypothetical protein